MWKLMDIKLICSRKNDWTFFGDPSSDLRSGRKTTQTLSSKKKSCHIISQRTNPTSHQFKHQQLRNNKKKTDINYCHLPVSLRSCSATCQVLPFSQELMVELKLKRFGIILASWAESQTDCWWKKSQTTTQHAWNLVNNGIFTISNISTGARFLPSTVPPPIARNKSTFYRPPACFFEKIPWFCEQNLLIWYLQALHPFFEVT